MYATLCSDSRCGRVSTATARDAVQASGEASTSMAVDLGEAARRAVFSAAEQLKLKCHIKHEGSGYVLHASRRYRSVDVRCCGDAPAAHVPAQVPGRLLVHARSHSLEWCVADDSRRHSLRTVTRRSLVLCRQDWSRSMLRERAQTRWHTRTPRR